MGLYTSHEKLPSDFDTFQDLMDRLSMLLQTEPKNEEAIRLALALDKQQTKGLLVKAVELGYIEKRKRPVCYALPLQKSLC